MDQLNSLKSVTAFILAGGKSSRMGEDKGLMIFEGKQLIVHLIELLNPIFKEVQIITNNEEYSKFELTIRKDIIKDRGPLAGIYAGLTSSETPWNFFVACDMPLISAKVIDHLFKKLNDFDLVVPIYQQYPEPLCAFYNVSCLPVIEKQLADGENKMQDIFPLLKFLPIEVTGLFSPNENPFRNLNTKDDLNHSINK